jgi:hypothetical protein
VCLFGFGDEWVHCGEGNNAAATPACGPDAFNALKCASECRAWRVADVVARIGLAAGERRIFIHSWPPRVVQSACGARHWFMVWGLGHKMYRSLRHQTHLRAPVSMIRVVIYLRGQSIVRLAGGVRLSIGQGLNRTGPAWAYSQGLEWQSGTTTSWHPCRNTVRMRILCTAAKLEPNVLHAKQIALYPIGFSGVSSPHLLRPASPSVPFPEVVLFRFSPLSYPAAVFFSFSNFSDPAAVFLSF